MSVYLHTCSRVTFMVNAKIVGSIGQFDHHLMVRWENFVLNLILFSHLVDDEFWDDKFESSMPWGVSFPTVELFGGRLWARYTPWVSTPGEIKYLGGDFGTTPTTAAALLASTNSTSSYNVSQFLARRSCNVSLLSVWSRSCNISDVINLLQAFSVSCSTLQLIPIWI